MLLVCLSVVFKFMNSITDCYKSGVNIMVIWGGGGEGGAPRILKFSFPKFSMKNVEGMRTFEV